jgi:hypothetical protein
MKSTKYAIMSVFAATEILEKRIINSDSAVGALSRNQSRLVQQSDLLWGQQAKINNSFRQFALDATAHLQKIDQKVDLGVNFEMPVLPEICAAKNIADIEAITAATPESCIKDKVQEAKTRLECINDVSYKMNESTETAEI